MKRTILFTCWAFLITCMKAQSPVDAGIRPPEMDTYTTLDSAMYKFTYDFTHVPDTTKLNSPLKNQLILQVGKNSSGFYSADYFKQREKDNRRKNADDGIPSAPGHGLNGTEIYKNYKTKEETVTTRVSGTSDIYTYQENIPDLKWTITSETSTILSYTCTKAITTFRGRTYEAWFTADIPINNGPWKFGGLPGLIIKLSDTQNHFTFNCIGIEQLKTKMPYKPMKAWDLPMSETNQSHSQRNHTIQLKEKGYKIENLIYFIG